MNHIFPRLVILFALLVCNIINTFSQTGTCPSGEVPLPNVTEVRTLNAGSCGSGAVVTILVVTNAIPDNVTSDAAPNGPDSFVLPSGWVYYGTTYAGREDQGALGKFDKWNVELRPPSGYSTGGSASVKNAYRCQNGSNPNWIYSPAFSFNLAAPSASSYTLTGPSLACSFTPITFNLNNVPAGSTISYGTLSGASVISGQGTTSVVVQGTYDGSQRLFAYINDPCGNAVTKTIDFFTGPAIDGYSTNGASTYGLSANNSVSLSGSNPNAAISISSRHENATFSWQITQQSSSGANFYNQGRNYSNPYNNTAVQIYCAPGKQLNATCTVTTPCGTFTYSFSCYNNSSGYRMAVYPNPAKDEVTITAVKDEDSQANGVESKAVDDEKPIDSKDVAEDVNVDIRLCDKSGLAVRSGRLEKGKIIFSVSDLIDGTYYLKMNDGEKSINKQVVIEH